MGYDKVWMYKEIMMNDDNLESNLLTSSLLKRHLVYVLVQVDMSENVLGNLTLQVNYAAGRLVAVIVYCFSGDLNLSAITVYTEV